MDKYFRVEKLRATPNPQQLCWLAMHQDYTGDAVVDSLYKCPGETKAGEYIVKRCLQFGHFGILEHAQISFNCVGFPHHTMVQLRTHRTGISFDVSSLRYCSQHIIDVSTGNRNVEEVFFLRPVSKYTNRHGAKYESKDELLSKSVEHHFRACQIYHEMIEAGYSEEHARENIPMSIRQNFVVSLNARSMLHVLDMRFPKNAQEEIRDLSALMFEQFAEWMPQVVEWYQKTRLGKNKLAP
jgi:thymidylate synthase (FAD)